MCIYNSCKCHRSTFAWTGRGMVCKMESFVRRSRHRPWGLSRGVWPCSQGSLDDNTSRTLRGTSTDCVAHLYFTNGRFQRACVRTALKTIKNSTPSAGLCYRKHVQANRRINARFSCIPLINLFPQTVFFPPVTSPCRHALTSCNQLHFCLGIYRTWQ